MTLFHSRLEPPSPPLASAPISNRVTEDSPFSPTSGPSPLLGLPPYSHSFHSFTQAGKVKPIPLSEAKSRGIRASWGEKDTAF